MAKTPKYEEDKLLEAVVKYADQHRGKIEATKLAKWASENVEGLEGVEDRHFMRPLKKKNPKTGKVTEQIKLCAAKINELNAARNTLTAMNTNVLLKSANIDRFFSLPIHEQRQLILETRTQVDKLVAENVYLRSENKAIAGESHAVATQEKSLSQKLERLQKDHSRLLTVVERVMEHYDEAECRKMLESIGVCDGTFDLDTYVDSLTIQLSDAFSINNAIKRNCVTKGRVDPNVLLGGIEFE